MSKVFAFSTRVRRRGSQCCTAHLISGSGCSGNEAGQKHPKISVTRDRLAWKMKMGSTYRAVPSALQVVTNMNEGSQPTGSSKEWRNCGARHAISSTRRKALGKERDYKE